MLDKKYYYELKYINGEESITFRFPAEIDTWEMTNQLGDFLRGCSWSDQQVNEILKLEEDYGN